MIRANWRLAGLGVAVLAASYATLVFAQVPATAPATAPATSLRAAASFDSIADPQARSVALFEEAGKVLTNPRCLNCHPAGDRPTQTNAMQPHQPLVMRNGDGMGAPGMKCTTCHHAANFDPANVPGHPEWHLAPLSMAWQGKSLGAICRQLKDTSLNGNRDLAALVKHMRDDTLVGWAWAPGGNRTPAPGTQAEFGALIEAWTKTGAACPSN